MNRPKVSVCVPNYNYGRFLEKAVESALNQTWEDFEIVVVDDASSDDSLSRLEAFHDERLRVYRNQRNLGRAANINKAFSLARGDYIAILPSDGLLLQESLERRVACLDNDPTVCLAYCGVRFIDEAGQLIGEHLPYPYPYVRSGTEEFCDLIGGNYIFPVSALMRRSQVEQVGGLNESVSPAHRDWHLFLRLAMAGHFAYLPEALVVERKHPGNFTEQIRFTEIPRISAMLVLWSVFQELRVAKSKLVRLEQHALRRAAIDGLVSAWDALAAGQKGLALKHIGISMVEHPGIAWNPLVIITWILTAFPRRVLRLLSYRFVQAGGKLLYGWLEARKPYPRRP